MRANLALMIDRDQRARELCDAALQHMWRGEVDAAIGVYERARELAASEELSELLTIRKAEALIAADRDGEEIGLLPRIVMRRRSPRHVYLASYALLRKYSEQGDRQRALFYGEIARSSVAELGDPMLRANVLNGIGITLTADSQFQAAVEAFDHAFAVLAQVSDRPDEVRSLFGAIEVNLGGAKVVAGDLEEGVRLIELSLQILEDEFARTEGYVDLCFAYTSLGEYARAARFGAEALELATTPRQVRNANHALADLAVRTGRYEDASQHFDVVAAFYPDFKHVKDLLLAVDLSTVVNWKA